MYLDAGLLLLRLVVGGLMFGHGAQKLFGWWGGPGLTGFIGMTGGHLRFRPAWLWGPVGALSETVGGLLVLLGLLHPLGAAAIVAAMLIAISVHWPAFWATERGYEYALLNLVAALGLALAGPGAYALDTVLGIALPEPATLILALGLAVLGAGVALATRAPASVAAPAPASS
ncbi:MAG: DoxX family membrane protein [Chloroflexota bacterium]